MKLRIDCACASDIPPAGAGRSPGAITSGSRTCASVQRGSLRMAMYHAEFLRRARLLCDRYDVHLIADEIAVGFGRTGTMHDHLLAQREALQEFDRSFSGVNLGGKAATSAVA